MSRKTLGNGRLENCAYRHIPTVEYSNGKVSVFCRCGMGVEEQDDDKARKSWNSLVAEQRKRRKKRFTPKQKPPRGILESVYQNPANTKKKLNTYRDSD